LTKVSILEDLAHQYLGAEQLSKSIATYEQTSVLLTNLGYGETKIEARVLQGWANSLVYAGRAFEAEKVLHRAFDISRTAQSENVNDPKLLNTYAEVLRQLGRLDEAALYAERGYQKAKEIRDNLIAEQSLLKREQIYREQHDLPRAAAMLAQVEPLMHGDLPAGNYFFKRLLSEKSLLAQANGDLPHALQLADEAVSEAEAAITAGHGYGERLVLPGFLLNRSGAELEAGETDKARADAERALSLLQARSEPGMFSIDIGRAYLALGRALKAQGKIHEARVAFRSAAEQLEHAGGPDHPDAHTARQLAGLAPK
jgi:tetratricopeptide (TPR) repeat protein